jgi:hypothetical protein
MFDIIWKEQIQKPKSGATIWQPKEKMKPDRKEDCNRWLRGLYDLFEKHKEADAGHPENITPGPSTNKYAEIPEKLACAIKEYLETTFNPDTEYGHPRPLKEWNNKFNIRLSFYFVDYIEMGLHVVSRKMALNKEILFLDLSSSWEKMFRNFDNDRAFIEAVREISKYCNNKNIWDYFVREYRSSGVSNNIRRFTNMPGYFKKELERY